LNSAARHSVGWDYLQFRTEEPDKRVKERKIDLVAAPCGTTVWIEGRRHIDFDTLLPIECKRLPTPKGADRDEREYVISRHSTTGGIQRFKEGHHGAGHALCAMIAYIEEDSSMFLCTAISQWITELAASGLAGWTTNEILYIERDDKAKGVAILRSSHARRKGLPDLDMRHLWVHMN